MYEIDIINDSDDFLEALLAQAGAALYKAKAKGRNSIIVANNYGYYYVGKNANPLSLYPSFFVAHLFFP
jgi:hypothetical protein